jgi:UDP-N-acetylglucosamine transferase subunit ALG13
LIFVTVGTQLRFDRLVAPCAEWLRRNRQPCFIQHAGYPLPLDPLPNASFLGPHETEEMLAKATLVVAHAGMGTILHCLVRGTPLIVMPRRASLGEHRNEHQLETVRWLRNREGLRVADDESALLRLLEEPLPTGDRAPKISTSASPQLLAAVRDFIWEGRTPPHSKS